MEVFIMDYDELSFEELEMKINKLKEKIKKYEYSTKYRIFKIMDITWMSLILIYVFGFWLYIFYYSMGIQYIFLHF